LEREYGAGRIWTAFDPNSRLIVCHYVGDRTLEDCREYFELLLNRLDGIPLCVSDELICYKTVLQENYSREVPIAPTGKRGRPKLPKKNTESCTGLCHSLQDRSKWQNNESGGKNHFRR
jgi:hypothetical protein